MEKAIRSSIRSDSFMWPKWYKGGQFNITETAVDKWAEKEETKHRPAIIWKNEAGEEKKWSFLELQEKGVALQLAF